MNADVFLSLKDDIIPNHGYVEISDIGSTDVAALLCHNNRLPSPHSHHSGGDWFAPNGTSVSFDNVLGFTGKRGSMVVRLKRINGTQAEGIYWCSIQDAASTIHTVFVGLYNSGKGIIIILKLFYLYYLHSLKCVFIIKYNH